MNVYQIRFDCTLITVVAEDAKSAMDLLREEDKDIVIKEPGKYVKVWSGGHNLEEDIEIKKINMNKPEIIHWESH